jgi:hypothetical protein
MYTDPSGHNPIPLFIISIEVAIVVSVTALIYSTPQMQELKDNFISMAKSGLPSWKYRKNQTALATSGYNAESPNGPKMKSNCKGHERECFVITVSAIIAIGACIRDPMPCADSENELKKTKAPELTESSSEFIPTEEYQINESLLPLYSPLEIPSHPNAPSNETEAEPITSPNINPRIIQKQWRLAY